MTKSDIFALVGICLLSLFGYAVWPPLTLGVFGIGFLRVAYVTAATPTEAEGDRE